MSTLDSPDLSMEDAIYEDDTDTLSELSILESSQFISSYDFDNSQSPSGSATPTARLP